MNGLSSLDKKYFLCYGTIMGAKYAKELRSSAKTDPYCFLRVKYDKLVNRVNGHGKQRYKDLPLLPRQEFFDWSMKCPVFNLLFQNWTLNGNQLRDIPTIDRIDNLGGYTINNMRWLRQTKNSSLGAKINKVVI